MENDPSSMRELVVELQKGFRLRKRKRRISDAVSVCSLDISLAPKQEKKRKRISKVVSLANLLSTPMRPVKRIGASLQHSFIGGRVDCPSTSDSPASSSHNVLQHSREKVRTSANKSEQMATPPCGNQRLTRCWSEAIGRNSIMKLSLQEVKRQEAIYELWSGEAGIVEDLEFVRDKYQISLMKLDLLSKEETRCVFGELDDLLKVHCSLRDDLSSRRDSAGITRSIGETLLNWIPGLNCYIGHCSNQVWARALLEEKNCNKRFQEFLKQRLDSSCSRKLDFWTYLDIPRLRLTKYPLLVGEILRHTPSTHEDIIPLSKAASALVLVLQQTDVAVGAAKCRLIHKKLHFPRGHSSMSLVDKSTGVLCSGELKDRNGMKLQCFLFDTCFVMTRICRPSAKFTVCDPVIPAEQLHVEEVELIKRSTGSQAVQFGRAAFRVGFKDTSVGSHCILVAANQHIRKHWLDCIKQMKPLEENVKTQFSSSSETKKRLKSLVPCKYIGKASWSENDSQMALPFRQQNRISITKDHLL